MKKNLFLSVILLSIPCLALQPNTLKTVRVGIVKNDPPFSVVTKHMRAGFDVELTKEIFLKRLNMNIVYCPLEAAELLAKLNSREIDIAASSKIAITRNRLSSAGFVKTNGSSKKTLALIFNGPHSKELDPTTALKVLSRQEDDIFFFGANEFSFSALVNAGVPRKQIQVLPKDQFVSPRQYINGFKDAYYDILFVGDSEFAHMLQQDTDGKAITYLPNVPLDEQHEILGFGYSCRPGDPLLTQVQAAVNGMIADGTLRKLIAQTQIPQNNLLQTGIENVELSLPQAIPAAGRINLAPPITNNIANFIDKKYCPRPTVTVK